PSAMSASPTASTTALPLEEPPAEWVGLWGLSTGIGLLVWLPPEKQRSSHTVLPTIVPPASRMRVTTVASISGTYPSSTREPFIIGTPATQMLSLIATRLPARLPRGAPTISVLKVQALYGFSAACGWPPGPRGYLTGSVGSRSWSKRS